MLIAPIYPAQQIGHPTKGALWVQVDSAQFKRGQTMRGGIDGLGELSVKVV